MVRGFFSFIEFLNIVLAPSNVRDEAAGILLTSSKVCNAAQCRAYSIASDAAQSQQCLQKNVSEETILHKAGITVMTV